MQWKVLVSVSNLKFNQPTSLRNWLKQRGKSKYLVFWRFQVYRVNIRLLRINVRLLLYLRVLILATFVWSVTMCAENECSKFIMWWRIRFSIHCALYLRCMHLMARKLRAFMVWFLDDRWKIKILVRQPFPKVCFFYQSLFVWMHICW